MVHIVIPHWGRQGGGEELPVGAHSLHGALGASLQVLGAGHVGRPSQALGLVAPEPWWSPQQWPDRDPDRRG